MPSLKEKIQTDLITSMKARNELETGTLRMLKAAILNWEVAGVERKEANDEDIFEIIKKGIKQRRDSVSQFRDGGRNDLADKEEAEIKFLEKYLPTQLREVEIESVVQKIIVENSLSGKENFGRVMGVVMSQLKGKADGDLVKKVVERVLFN